MYCTFREEEGKGRKQREKKMGGGRRKREKLVGTPLHEFNAIQTCTITTTISQHVKSYTMYNYVHMYYQHEMT